MCDQIRFFAGAARVLEGKSAGEYMSGFTSFVRREPVGVCARGDAVELPGDDGRLEVGAGARGRQHDGAQAVRHHAGEHGLDGRADGRVPAARRVQRRLRRPRHRRRARAPPDPRDGRRSPAASAPGIAVAKAAADDVKRVHLELGGKAPVIVFDDADLELAAENIAIAGYFNAGQDCTAATRVLAGPRVHDDFVAALAEQAQEHAARARRTTARCSTARSTTPTSSRTSAASSSARPTTPTVVAGGHRQGDRGYFFEPTIVDGLRQDDEMIQNEIFGPVISVQTFSDEDEAIAWANGVPFGARLERLDRGPRPRDAHVAARSTSAACGSTATSRSWPRCRTAASSTPATARTSRSTGSRTTRASSTS